MNGEVEGWLKEGRWTLAKGKWKLVLVIQAGQAPLCDFLFRGPLGPKYRRAGGCQVGSRLADMLAHRIGTFSHRLTYCSQGFSTTSCGFTQSQAETRCICLWKTRFPYRLACRNGSLSSSLARGRHSDPSDYHSCISLVYLVRHCRSFESC